MSSLTMSNKVLLALYKLWSKGRRKVKYEDIVVQVFRDFPHDFQLKGYPEYPDSGDAVHKPLYDYRKRGLVAAANKMFALTDPGVEEAQRLLKLQEGESAQSSPGRLGRTAQIELERIKNLESFKLFVSGRSDEIIDADLFDYLGVSVRTSRNDFIGRLRTIEKTIASISEKKDDLVDRVLQFHGFIFSKFANEIAFKAGPR